MKQKPFKKMTSKEKDAFVNSGNGQRLTKEQSVWKTRNWTIMQAIKKGKVPSDTFGQLAFNLFKS